MSAFAEGTTDKPVRRAFLPDRSSVRGTPAEMLFMSRGGARYPLGVPHADHGICCRLSGLPKECNSSGEWGDPAPLPTGEFSLFSLWTRTTRWSSGSLHSSHRLRRWRIWWPGSFRLRCRPCHQCDHTILRLDLGIEGTGRAVIQQCHLDLGGDGSVINLFANRSAVFFGVFVTVISLFTSLTPSTSLAYSVVNSFCAWLAASPRKVTMPSLTSTSVLPALTLR